jgi:hypothetical protein
MGSLNGRYVSELKLPRRRINESEVLFVVGSEQRSEINTNSRKKIEVTADEDVA